MALLSQLNHQLRTYLNQKNVNCALEVIRDDKYEDILKENCADIFLIITEYLSEFTKIYNSEIYKLYETLLNLIAKKSKPQDVLYEIMNIIDSCKKDSTLFFILPAFEICWERVPSNRLDVLQWSLNSVYLYIDSVFQNKEETDENSDNRIFGICENVTNFCLNVGQQISSIDVNLDKSKKCNYLIKFIIKLIGKPIAYLNCNYLPVNKYKEVINNLLSLLKLLNSDIYSFIKHIDQLDGDKDEFEISALGTVYFLFFIESNQSDTIKVYSPNYIVRNMMYMSSILLKKSNEILISQGIQLSQHVLDLIDFLDEFELDGIVYKLYFISLSNVIIYNANEKLRKSALKVITKCLLKFSDRARYLLLQNLIPSISHSGLKGHICILYKDMLREAFDRNTELPLHFCGMKLLNILTMFTNLPSGPKTDLLDQADQIISALNILRYLFIRDKHNVSKIWFHIQKIQETFIVPLRDGLKMSKAHYEMKLKELIDEKKVTKDDVDFEVFIGNGKLPELSLSNKISAMQSSLNAFDIIESLMIYLEENIDSKQCNMLT